MIESIREFVRVQHKTISTSIYLLKRKKTTNLISVATAFWVIIIPLTLILISSNYKDSILAETQPYSYLIFKTDTTGLEIEEFIKYAKQIKNIEIKQILPQQTKNKFFKSLGIDLYNAPLKFPHSAEILYPSLMKIGSFRDAHNFIKAHDVIQSAESNQQFIIATRLMEKVLLWFLYISFIITTIFCILVSYISSKNLLLLYSEEIKGLMLAGLGENAVKQPIILCGMINGIILAALLHLTSAFLATKTSFFINEYVGFEGNQSGTTSWPARESLALISFSLASYMIGARLATRHIIAKILIE